MEERFDKFEQRFDNRSLSSFRPLIQKRIQDSLLDKFDKYGVYQQLGFDILPKNIKTCKPSWRYRNGMEGLDFGLRAVTAPVALLFSNNMIFDSFIKKGESNELPSKIKNGELSIADYYCQCINSESFIEDIYDPEDMKKRFPEWSLNDELAGGMNYFEYAAYIRAKKGTNGADFLLRNFLRLEQYIQKYHLNVFDLLMIGEHGGDYLYRNHSDDEPTYPNIYLSFDILVEIQDLVLAKIEEANSVLSIWHKIENKIRVVDGQDPSGAWNVLDLESPWIILVNNELFNQLDSEIVVNIDSRYRRGYIIYFVTLDGFKGPMKKYIIEENTGLFGVKGITIHPYDIVGIRFRDKLLRQLN